MRSTKTIAQTSNKGKNRRRIISALDQKQTTPLEEDLLNRPVESVTYRDILKFLEKVNKAHKINLRLPTETEWELAAGDVDSQPILDIAWCCENSGGSTHLVGQKLPNHFGLYDMLGNVWEWTSTKDLGGHVLRGGSSLAEIFFVRRVHNRLARGIGMHRIQNCFFNSDFFI